MNTTGLDNCVIDIRGTLLVGSTLDAFRVLTLLSGAPTSGTGSRTLPHRNQNQSSPWRLGGASISFVGHGYGTLDGKGQTWYNYSGFLVQARLRGIMSSMSGIAKQRIRRVTHRGGMYIEITHNVAPPHLFNRFQEYS